MIRKARLSDLDDLLHLYDHLRGGLSYVKRKAMDPTPRHKKALREMLKDPRSLVLVAESRGKVLGTCTLYVLNRVYWQGKPWGVLDSIVVAESAQGQGVGTQLIRHAIKLAKKAGCTHINLTSNTQRVRAHIFYESLGFERTYVGFKMSF
ncbi:MAG: GNAT family N-acetyltransferase [candidate division FCPU426 bacterium]